MVLISITPSISRELRGFIILASAFLLIQEFQTSQLTVWPIDHSCNLNRNLTNEEYTLDLGSNRSFTAQVVQLSLFDVAQEESPVVAKAISEGIHYEDIAHCYQHPSETDKLGQTTIDRENIERCRNGLHFEQHSNNLSTVAYFQLACDRQWLRALLPQSIGIGFLGGSLLAYGISQSIFPSTLRCRYAALGQLINEVLRVDVEDTFNTWLYFQFFALLLIYGFQIDLARSYTNILTCAFLRSLVVGLCLARVLFHWIVEGTPLPANAGRGTQDESLNYLEDNQRCFVASVWIYIVFQALYDPLALRIVSDWIQMNKWLTIEATMLVVLTAIGQLLSIPTTSWTILEPDDRSSADCYEPAYTVEPPADEPHDLSSVGRHQSRQNQYPRDHRQVPMKLCEFCLIKEDPQHAIAMINQSNRQQHQQNNETGNCQEGDLDSYVTDTMHDLITYEPTTVPNFASDGGSWLASGTSRRQHNFGAFHHDLLNRSTICQLWILAFCVCLNYFLLRFLPDHTMLHPESLASRFARKIQYRKTHPLANSTTATTALHSNITTENNSIPSTVLEEDFDYSSINYASHAIDLMMNSSNPFQVLATTIMVNGWLVELTVMLLHVASLSRFSANYFKLNQLLTLVRVGSLVLAVEWILIGLLRRQNHLIEWAWLQSLALGVARFSATLVLFNYFFTALKISQRLGTNQLIRFLPSAIAGLLSLSLASLVPILEKVDLVIIPISLAINNVVAYLISRSLGNLFRRSLCPMLFSGDETVSADA